MISDEQCDASEVTQDDVELLPGENFEFLSRDRAFFKRLEVAMLQDLLVDWLQVGPDFFGQPMCVGHCSRFLLPRRPFRVPRCQQLSRNCRARKARCVRSQRSPRNGGYRSRGYIAPNSGAV